MSANQKKLHCSTPRVAILEVVCILSIRHTQIKMHMMKEQNKKEKRKEKKSLEHTLQMTNNATILPLCPYILWFPKHLRESVTYIL